MKKRAHAGKIYMDTYDNLAFVSTDCSDAYNEPRDHHFATKCVQHMRHSTNTHIKHTLGLVKSFSIWCIPKTNKTLLRPRPYRAANKKALGEYVSSALDRYRVSLARRDEFWPINVKRVKIHTQAEDNLCMTELEDAHHIFEGAPKQWEAHNQAFKKEKSSAVANEIIDPSEQAKLGLNEILVRPLWKFTGSPVGTREAKVKKAKAMFGEKIA